MTTKVCTKCGGKPAKHKYGDGQDLCCECHVKNGSAPANWHDDCMKAYRELKK